MRALRCALLLLFIACGSKVQDPTQVVLVVDSDYRVPDEMDQIEVFISIGASEKFKNVYDLGTGDNRVSLPLTLGLLSPDDGSHTFRVQVSGLRKGRSAPLVVRSATLQFLPRTVLRLDLNLLEVCQEVSCQPGDTCYDDGRCASERVDRRSLPPLAQRPVPDGSVLAPIQDRRDGPAPSISDAAPAGVDGSVAMVDGRDANIPDRPPTDGGGDRAIDAPAADAAPVPCAARCAGGQCYGDICCRGCWDGQRCRPGTELDACATGGVACRACNDNNECTSDTCSAGTCQSTPSTGPCANGVCVDRMCVCGGAGQPCCKPGSSCMAGLTCNAGTCQCGGVNQPCCGGTMCGAGAQCSGGMCLACGGNGQPCCGGTMCGASLACLSGACRCGGYGQPCCGGASGMCSAGFACNNGTCGCAPGVIQCGGVCRPGWSCCPGTVGGRCDRCGTAVCNSGGGWDCTNNNGACVPNTEVCDKQQGPCATCGPDQKRTCDNNCNLSGCFP